MKELSYDFKKTLTSKDSLTARYHKLAEKNRERISDDSVYLDTDFLNSLDSNEKTEVEPPKFYSDLKRRKSNP